MNQTPDYSIPNNFQHGDAVPPLPPFRKRRRKLDRRIIGLVSLALMLAATIGGFKAIEYSQDLRSKAGSAAAVPIHVSFASPTLSAVPGDTVMINVNVDTHSQAMSGIEYKLDYDPEALRYQSYQPSGLNRLISTEGGNGQIAISQTINCTPGCDQPVSGQASIGTITFVVLSPDTSVELEGTGLITVLGETENLYSVGETSTVVIKNPNGSGKDSPLQGKPNLSPTSSQISNPTQLPPPEPTTVTSPTSPSIKLR